MTHLYAPAKLNLTLDIVGVKDNYHLLDSLVTTIDLCDRISVRKRRDGKVKISMHGMGSEYLPEEKNNAYQAALLFCERFSAAGGDITVYKNIPMSAGLGGSSADAAGVLRAMAQEYQIDDMGAVKELADALGSDTGYLLFGGFARLRGRGEKIEQLGELPNMWFLVACPDQGVETAACFKEFDRRNETFNPRSERAAALLARGNVEEGAKLFFNALGAASQALEPSVEETLRALKNLSPMGSSVTGSGSACFAAFPTRELAEWAKSRYRGKGRTYVVRPYTETRRGAFGAAL